MNQPDPSSSLHTKLQEKLEDILHDNGVHSLNCAKAAAQILQALQESIMPILNKQNKTIQDIIDANNLMANTVLLPNVMTGPEFYDRFKAELDKELLDVMDEDQEQGFSEKVVLEAARRAAGVSDE